MNYPFEEGDRVRLELFRMNKDTYDYFTQLVGLLFNDGGLFSPLHKILKPILRWIRAKEKYWVIFLFLRY
ncbi:hypothetical protein V8V91_26950 [Algoriphagus halophilus]|uniref:hypothetical protein n=1 Tax=Algoriphagus halophilus TaxID=226505 RepID=UPI00358ED52A